MTALHSAPGWIPETSGEKLFLYLYGVVAPHVPELFTDQSWVVSSRGMSDFFRLTATMELTHRCLNEGVDLVSTNENASSRALVYRLQSRVGLTDSRLEIFRIAEMTRIAALSYVTRKLTTTRADEIHRQANKRCCWCGALTSRAKATPKHEQATVEHLWPEFLGGTSSPENLTIACKDCNERRQHAFTWAWFRTQSFTGLHSATNFLPKEMKLAAALHRLVRIASGQTHHSTKRTTLKEAVGLIPQAIPTFACELDTRYTFFEILNLATE